ncbi:hypothetical protein Tco_1097203 [Tanacetum coccineum]
MVKRMMTGTKFHIKKFDGKNDFGLWQVRMKALPEQQGLAAGFEELPAAMIVAYDSVIRKGLQRIDLVFGNRALRDITKETTAARIWKKLETLYMKKYLANRLYLKKKLYTFYMHPGKSQSEHIDEFHKLVGDLAAINTAISNEDHTLLLLTSLPLSYDNFVDTLLYGRDQCFKRLAFTSEEHLKKDCPRYNHKKSQGFVRNEDHVSGSRADGYDSVDIMMVMSVEQLLDWIMDSGGSYHMTYIRGYLFDFEEYDSDNILLGDGMEYRSGKIKVRKGSLVLLSGTRRANCVYTLDGQIVTRKTLKGRKQLGEYQTEWKIKKSNVLDSCNQRSPLSAIGFKTPVDMLGFFGWLVSMKQGMLEPVKVKCIFLGYHKGTGLMHVLHGFEFEVELQEDHAFEVEPLRNVGQGAVAAVDKIYAHESLTFNNIVTCKVISKWKAGLKDDIDARSKCAESWATKGLLDKAIRIVLGMEIVKNQCDNTLRVSQSRFYDEKLVQTLLDGHSILS